MSIIDEAKERLKQRRDIESGDSLADMHPHKEWMDLTVSISCYVAPLLDELIKANKEIEQYKQVVEAAIKQMEHSAQTEFMGDSYFECINELKEALNNLPKEDK